MPYTLTLVAIVAGYTWVVDQFFDLRGLWRQVPTILVLAVGLVHAIRTREWGLSPRALGPATIWTVVFTVPAVAIIISIGVRLGTWHARGDVWWELLSLILWGGGQQWLLQTVVLHEARQRWPRAAAVILAAMIFAALHLPNPFLTLLTGLAALAWCSIYLRAPNLLPLALSHALLTLAVLHAFDPDMTGHLRTGWHYLERR